MNAKIYFFINFVFSHSWLWYNCFIWIANCVQMWYSQHQINMNKSFHKIKKHLFFIYFEGSINKISLSEHAFGIKNAIMVTHFKQNFQCYECQCWSYCYKINQQMYKLRFTLISNVMVSKDLYKYVKVYNPPIFIKS